jgi:hypothetical protein
VELKIKNIDPGVYNYKKYIIDGDMTEIHSNPCRYNKKTESSPSNTECGANGALKQAINQANYDSNNAKMNYLLSIGYQQNNVDQYMNCSNNPNCDTDSLINDYCQQNPILCPKIKNDLMEAQELSDYLFYHGSYTGTDGKTYTIPIYVDQINHSKEVSLEGSKKEKQVTLTDSTFTENFMMQPYSVVLLEISLFLPTPIIPNGPTNGATHNSYTYSTSGSTSILVQPVEYQFDWKGDGTDLSPWGPDTQSKTWTSPGTYMVKARARYATNTSVVSGWSSGLLVTIDGISIISPNGGENWKAGTTQTISWIFKGNIGDYIKIELLKGGTGNSTITFRTSIGNGESGSYSWRIPKFKTPGSDYTLRITSTSNNYYSDASDNFFTISK